MEINSAEGNSRSHRKKPPVDHPLYHLRWTEAMGTTEPAITSMVPAVFARSSTLRASATGFRSFPIKPPFSAALSRLCSTRAYSAPSQALEVCVKESGTVPGRIGNCPFSQTVLLTLEEKHVPYDMKLVDLANKPEWFLKVNPQGKVPIAKIDEKWVADSDVITQSIEEKYPHPPLATPPEKATTGSKIFPTFIRFLRSKNSSNGIEKALLSELTSFNDYIKENGPFISGDMISAVDLSLAPKLYHLKIALGNYKHWSVPESLPYVRSYMESIFSRDSFTKTQPLPEDVLEEWRQIVAA